MEDFSVSTLKDSRIRHCGKVERVSGGKGLILYKNVEAMMAEDEINL